MTPILNPVERALPSFASVVLDEAVMASPKRTKKTACTHGKYSVYMCLECDGRWLCAHLKRRCYCKECGADKRCPHGRQSAYYCVDCKGRGVCEHGRIRYYCKTCKGAAFCVHDLQKRYCAVCGGHGLCTHGHQRGNCATCTPKASASAGGSGASAASGAGKGVMVVPVTAPIVLMTPSTKEVTVVVPADGSSGVVPLPDDVKVTKVVSAERLNILSSTTSALLELSRGGEA